MTLASWLPVLRNLTPYGLRHALSFLRAKREGARRLARITPVDLGLPLCPSRRPSSSRELSTTRSSVETQAADPGG